MILLSLGLASRIKRLKEEKLQSELQTVSAERQLAESRKKLEEQMAVSALASQVAHDIRSPLAALDSVIKDVAQLPEQKRIIVRNAVSRIHDIANDLIGKNRELAAAAQRATGLRRRAQPRRLRASCYRATSPRSSRKRLQYRAKMTSRSKADSMLPSYGLFATYSHRIQASPVEYFHRHAVEASWQGHRDGLLDRDGDRVQLQVKDNGKGIQQMYASGSGGVEKLRKAGGSGLGLYHAKTASRPGGNARTPINCRPGNGSAKGLQLPRRRPGSSRSWNYRRRPCYYPRR